MMIGTMIFSLGFAIGIFFVLPLFLSTFADDATDSDLLANLVEGLIRLAVFVAYIRLIGLMGDIKRVFAYHGAEHKAISAHEAQRPLTPVEVDRFSTAHTRCGTTFLLIVVVISIFFFSLIPRAGVPLPVLFLSRIALVPFIAAVSYELVRFGASHYGNRLVRAIYQPGPLAAVAHHPAAGPRHAGGEHRLAGVLPGVGSRRRHASRSSRPPTSSIRASASFPDDGPMIERLREIEASLRRARRRDGVAGTSRWRA